LGKRSWGLRQASAPAARASPHCDSSVLPVPGAVLNAGKSECIVRAPAPLGAGMAQGGLERSFEVRQFSQVHTWSPGAPKFSRQFCFSSGKIRAYKLSSGTFFELSDFKPKKIRPEKFQSNFFFFFQLSTGKFFGFSTFAAKKSPGFFDPGTGSVLRDLRRRSELVV
jgi:hypothetical protein